MSRRAIAIAGLLLITGAAWSAGRLIETGRCTITRYCIHCAGHTCADGSHVRKGIVAAPKRIPMGSTVWLEGEGFFKVTDRGGAIKGRKFDVWVPGNCRDKGTRRNVKYKVWVKR